MSNINAQQSFRLVYEFFNEFNGKVLTTENDWKAFAESARDTADQMGVNGTPDNNPLGWRLLDAVMETISEQYRGGKVPKPINYFGREDL